MYFEDLLDFLQKRLKNVNNEISLLPEGILNCSMRGGKTVYSYAITQNGNRKRTVITNNDVMISSLARKEYLRAERDIIEHNIELLTKIEERYIEVTEDNVFRKIKKAYKDLPEKYFLSNCREEGSWGECAYEQSCYKPENKIHVTSRGLKVRSKSELIICENLYANHVEFRYEQILKIGDKTFAPDFTIKRQDGKIIYWEHCGLINNEAYMASHKNKIRTYEGAGIVPWDNLIVTYDNPDGTLNIRIIDSEIQNKILN